MSFVPKKTLQDLGKRIATPKKTKQKSKAISKASKLKQPETYYYSVSDRPMGKEY